MIRRRGIKHYVRMKCKTLLGGIFLVDEIRYLGDGSGVR